MSRPSYWLKIDRATEHLEEIKVLIAPYAVSRPYEVRHSIEGKNKDHIYSIFPIEEADPWIAIVLGDFLFDLRSALDHLRAALVPRKRRYSGAFPIFTENIWDRDAHTGEHSERTADSRQFWESSVSGMDERAVEYIDLLQPFRLPKDSIGERGLALLNRWNNADKHRALVPVIGFLELVECVIHYPSGPQVLAPSGMPEGAVGHPGAVVARLKSEVKVEARGPLVITIGGTSDAAPAGYRLPITCDEMLNHIAKNVVPLLEQFVRS